MSPNMTFDSENKVNGKSMRRKSSTKINDENNGHLGVGMISLMDFHSSSSTTNLCQSDQFNENDTNNCQGIANQAIETINLDQNPNQKSEQTLQVTIEPQKSWYKSMRGMFLTILSALFFSVTTVIVKYVKDVDAAQMAFFRFFGILLFTIPLVMDCGLNPLGPKKYRHWLVLRGIAGATSLFFRYSALHYMSIANATVIVLSMPVFVFIFARIFLKESFGWFHIIALIITLIGITFTSKLAIIFIHTSDAIKQFGIDSKKELIGLAYSLGATLVGSAAYVLVRKIKEVKHSIILFNFSWIAMIETSILTFCLYDFKIPNNMPAINANAWLLCLLAVFSFYGQLLLTKALQAEEAGLVSITRASSEVIYSFIFQITIFKEMPDQWSYFGAFLVMSSVLMTSFRKWVIGIPKDSLVRRKFNFITK